MDKRNTLSIRTKFYIKYRDRKDQLLKDTEISLPEMNNIDYNCWLYGYCFGDELNW
jgi:hypothetical protein